jgi:ABC-type cobalamin/Fe3+-siderophores transport system ATPase subunit
MMNSIMKISTKEHYILGDNIFNFMNENSNEPFNTIVIAGENGTGKTSLLNLLSEISKIFIYLIKNSDISLNFKFDFEMMLNGEVYIFKSTQQDSKKLSFIAHKKDGTQVDKIKDCSNDTHHIPFLFSNVAINFDYANKTATTALKIDDENRLSTDNHSIIESTSSLADQIAQLFIDIELLDNREVVQSIKQAKTAKESTVSIDSIPLGKRMDRFNKAFFTIFETDLIFDRIDNIPDNNSSKIEIFFKKRLSGDVYKEVPLRDLSSGQKQIIFRAAFLLRDINVLKGCTVLIDEPELSMHPKWQDKLLDFYKSLFTENGVQTSQIFIATHSDHILKSALEDDDTLILKLKNGEQPEPIYKGKTGTYLETVTLGEVKWRIFDMATIDFHIELFGYLHKRLMAYNLCDTTISSVDSYIENHISGRNDMLVMSNNLPQSNCDNGRKIHIDKTIPAYIRNYIDHPKGADRSDECLKYLKVSIEFMREMIDSLNHNT